MNSMLPTPPDCGAPCATCEALAHDAARLREMLAWLERHSPLITWKGSSANGLSMFEITRANPDGTEALYEEDGVEVIGTGSNLAEAVADAMRREKI